MAKFVTQKGIETNLEIESVHAFDNEKYNGIRISWSAKNIGFGDCDILFEDGGGGTVISADTECMCNNNDKEFLRALLNELVDMTTIIG